MISAVGAWSRLRSTGYLWLSAAAVVTGCGEDPDTSGGVGLGGDAGVTSAGTTAGTTGGTVGGTTTGGVGGTTTGTAVATTGTSGATSAGSTTGAATGGMTQSLTANDLGDGLPCDVRQVLTESCGTCHGSPAQFGAPTSFVTQPEFEAAAVSPGMTVAQAVKDRLHTTDTAKKMPPASQPPISAENLAVLDAWLDSGAPYVSEECAPVEGGGTSGGTSGGTGEIPADANLKCYKFTAHAPGDKEIGYKVGAVRDGYVNFNFMPPWEGVAYARTISSIIDNSRALHHWLFFKNGGPSEDGSVADSSGTHPGSELVYGWAPGGENLNMYDTPGEDVGIPMPGNVSYTVEMHYNSDDAAAIDASGVEVCVSEKEPEQKAAQAWLGTDAIVSFLLPLNDMKAGAVCDPTSNEPIHILGVSPHMHLKGRHMEAIINRADGSKEDLHVGDFAFDDQTVYRKDVWLMPGDTISTTCTYSEAANFGEGTNDEMCYLFTMHTPAGALTDNGAVGAGIHGDNVCLGL